MREGCCVIASGQCKASPVPSVISKPRHLKIHPCLLKNIYSTWLSFLSPRRTYIISLSITSSIIRNETENTMADGNNSLRMPDATARDMALGRMSDDPTSLLHESLYSEDAFHGQTYWADLPGKEQAKWISEQNNAEAAREFSQVWQTFKTDPLKPFTLYFHNYAVTGLGFFTEGYTLFSVGNILSLFEAVWPACFKGHKFVICYGSSLLTISKSWVFYWDKLLWALLVLSTSCFTIS